jgi:DNA topoisomerase IA
VPRRFFNTLKPAHIYNAIKNEVDIAGFAFHGSGTALIQAGWKMAKDEDGEDTEYYSGLAEAGEYPVDAATKEEKFTGPKKHYTYATLLQLMENPRNEEGKHLAGKKTKVKKCKSKAGKEFSAAFFLGPGKVSEVPI